MQGGSSPLASGGGFSADVGAANSSSGDLAQAQQSPIQGGGFDLMGMLGAFFQDPESAKAISDTAGKLATTIGSAQKIPPHAQAFMSRAISQGIQQQQDRDMLNPYGGDMMRFITPEMARGVLDGMGIPYGRMRF